MSDKTNIFNIEQKKPLVTHLDIFYMRAFRNKLFQHHSKYQNAVSHLKYLRLWPLKEVLFIAIKLSKLISIICLEIISNMYVSMN